MVNRPRIVVPGDPRRDSNVVVGGTGDVNAQIADSDTGGTVVMDTVDSIAHGGNSR